eukprot:GHRR01011641.1.p1 GENE.GHRR01011641.1~~GHRR01011641.1.p1  ORF type:complete len:698 (+),score=354.14 GHRR01011641.1:186-2279(+)
MPAVVATSFMFVPLPAPDPPFPCQVDIFCEGDEVNELMFVVGGYLEVFASSSAAEAKDRESILAAVRYSRSPSMVLQDMVAGRKVAAGSGYSMLGPGDVIGEVAFFTEVPQFELVRSLTVCRVLVVPRPAYVALAADFPMSATSILEALQKNAEQVLATEFRGGAASRLLRNSLVQSLPGLSYAHTSAETLNSSQEQQQQDQAQQADNNGGARPNLSGAASVGGLSIRQQQVVGNLQRIRAIVKHHVAQADEMRMGQFLAAAAKGQADRVKLLLQQGFNANTADYDKRTALMLAATNGHKAVVDMLLAVNANVNAKDNNGCTALLEAARAGAEDIVNILLARGAKLQMDGQAQAQALSGAVARGDIVQLRHLLAAGADADATDYDRRTALHVAAAEGNVQAVRVLVDKGHAQLDAVSGHGYTPLDEAHRAAATALIEYMESVVPPVEAAAARKRAEAWRASNLLRAAASGDVAGVQRLLDHGCPPDVCDYDKRTGLMLAAAHGHTSVVSMLLSAGANPNVHDNVGGSPLLEAVRNGRASADASADQMFGLIRQLTAAGARLQLSSIELSTKLCNLVMQHQQLLPASLGPQEQLAQRQHCVALLRRYIAAGADVSAGDYDSRTPLHLAAAEGSLEMVRLLVEEGGADLSATDRWGATPLDEAKRVKAIDVARYLSSSEAAEAAAAARAAMTAAAAAHV